VNRAIEVDFDADFVKVETRQWLFASMPVQAVQSWLLSSKIQKYVARDLEAIGVW
jgi:hypothetical protein